MKVPLLLFLLLPFVSFSQIDFDLDHVGEDDTRLLNQDEIDYTRYLLAHFEPETTYDLHGKRVLFLTGTYGSSHETKSAFFNHSCKPWTVNNDMPNIQLIELTKGEADELGYDIILVSWSKISHEGKVRKKFIKNAREAIQASNP